MSFSFGRIADSLEKLSRRKRSLTELSGKKTIRQVDMNKRQRTLAAAAVFIIFGAGVISCVHNTDDEEESNEQTTVGEEVQVKVTSSTELAKEIAIGWNLGNTLDATGSSGVNSETSWGQPRTTKAMIDGIKSAGFKTIRLPVSWHNHIDDTSSYTINAEWLSRVKEVVDWAYQDGLYIILNTHHDNAGKASEVVSGSALYHPTSAAYSESSKFLKSVWTQIASAFNNEYDEHLIFEVLNEPRLTGTNFEWWFDANSSVCQEGAKVLKSLEQDCLDAIRATGGNNASRYVLVPALSANPDAALSDCFALPSDSADDRLIVSVHSYRPYTFAMYDANISDTTFDSADEEALKSDFEKLYNKFTKNGVGVVIGETSATNKDNLEERVKWAKYFFGTAYEYGMPSIIWDNGAYAVSTTSGEQHGYYNRSAQTWYFPTMIDAAMSAVGITSGKLTASN